MFGLVVIVLVVALALTMTIRIQRRLSMLRRRAGEETAGPAAVAEYNAAIEAFPARLIAPALGFHPRSGEQPPSEEL